MPNREQVIAIELKSPKYAQRSVRETIALSIYMRHTDSSIRRALDNFALFADDHRNLPDEIRFEVRVAWEDADFILKLMAESANAESGIE